MKYERALSIERRKEKSGGYVFVQGYPHGRGN